MIVQNLPMLPSLIAALGVGALVGLYNGFLIVKIKLPDFVATIGTLYIAGGARFLLTKGYPLSPLPYNLGDFGRATPFGLSWPFFIMLGLYLTVAVVIKRTVFGRQLLATGDNREVAALSGINVARMRMTAYTICGFLCALAGVLLTIDLNNGVPQNGDGWEFRAIASCAVGGVSLLGGKGSAIGVLFGVLTMTIIDNSLIMMGVAASWQRSVTGIILAAAVMFDIVKQRQKVKV
jgi:ribose transport system permease protein